MIARPEFLTIGKLNDSACEFNVQVLLFTHHESIFERTDSPNCFDFFFLISRSLYCTLEYISIHIYRRGKQEKQSALVFGREWFKQKPQNLNTSLSWKLRPDEMIDQVKFGVQLQKKTKTKKRGVGGEPVSSVRSIKKRTPNCGRIQHDHPVIYTPFWRLFNSLLAVPCCLLLLLCVFYSTLQLLSRMTLVSRRRRPFFSPPPSRPASPFWLSTIAKRQERRKGIRMKPNEKAKK